MLNFINRYNGRAMARHLEAVTSREFSDRWNRWRWPSTSAFV